MFNAVVGGRESVNRLENLVFHLRIFAKTIKLIFWQTQNKGICELYVPNTCLKSEFHQNEHKTAQCN